MNMLCWLFGIRCKLSIWRYHPGPPGGEVNGESARFDQLPAEFRQQLEALDKVDIGELTIEQLREVQSVLAREGYLAEAVRASYLIEAKLTDDYMRGITELREDRAELLSKIVQIGQTP